VAVADLRWESDFPTCFHADDDSLVHGGSIAFRGVTVGVR
jgi:hypothetical protein